MLKECDLVKASRLYKAKTGVGCEGFHPRVPVDLTKETRVGVVALLEKGEQSGRWPQQACTTMFFLIRKNVTRERPIALVPTLIRWWEALRAPEVAMWQHKISRGLGHHGWSKWRSSTDSYGNVDGNGEVQKSSGRGRFASGGLVLDPAKAFERVSPLWESQERSHWCLIWLKLSSRSVFQWCGLGRRHSVFPGRF